MTKFQVYHIEYRKLAGYSVPVDAVDGEFESRADALSRASELRESRRTTFFVKPILKQGAGIGLPIPKAKGVAA